jgi:hypothetical protein
VTSFELFGLFVPCRFTMTRFSNETVGSFTNYHVRNVGIVRELRGGTMWPRLVDSCLGGHDPNTPKVWIPSHHDSTSSLSKQVLMDFSSSSLQSSTAQRPNLSVWRLDLRHPSSRQKVRNEVNGSGSRYRILQVCIPVCSSWPDVSWITMTDVSGYAIYAKYY